MVRDNSGTLSKNLRKEKDNHPDIKGKATVDGVEYWLAGWARKGQDGSLFYALAFTPKDESRERVPVSDDDKDIPF